MAKKEHPYFQVLGKLRTNSSLVTVGFPSLK